MDVRRKRLFSVTQQQNDFDYFLMFPLMFLISGCLDDDYRDESSTEEQSFPILHNQGQHKHTIASMVLLV